MSFLLVHAEHADTRWLQLADVIVLSTQPTVSAADGIAGATLHRLTGCALVVVGVDGLGCLLRYRDGHRKLIKSWDGSADDAIRLATLDYTMVLTAWAHSHRFEPAVRQDPLLAGPRSRRRSRGPQYSTDAPL